MNTQYSSKHGVVSRSPAELYMSFTDMRNILRFLPEDKRQDITADFDNLTAKVSGMTIGVKVTRREPYSYIELQDREAPVHFMAALHFDSLSGDYGKTDFYITAEAGLNLMMKMMVGNKVKDALDKIVDGLVDISNGKIPDDIPEDLRNKMYGF